MYSAAISYDADAEQVVQNEAALPPRPVAVALPRPTPRRIRWPIAFSVMLHAAAAAALVPWLDPETGTLEEPTEAVSIELVASHVIEQAVADLSADAAQSPAATAVTDGEAVEALAAAAVAEPAAAVEATMVEKQAVPALEEVESVITGAGAESDFAAKEPVTRRPEPVPTPEPRKVREKERTKARDVPAKTADKGKATETRQKGGVVSRGSADRAATAGRVSASAGSIAGYASRVRARVAANKPSASGRGTAVVSFRVTNSGGLASARLARSSGVAAIDQAAVAAVRRSAPFPSPPPGASAGQLAFSIPFHFR